MSERNVKDWRKRAKTGILEQLTYRSV